MITTLPPGLYRLISTGGVAAGKPTSVTYLRSPWQVLGLGLPCDTWKIIGNEYSLCGYSYVGLRGNRVIVSIFPEDRVKWTSTEYDGAYIIGLASDPNMVWTVSNDLPDPCIVISPLSPDGPTPDQLFKYVPEEE